MSTRTEASHPPTRRPLRRARWLRGPSRLLAWLLSSLAASLAAAQILPPAPNALPTGGKVVVGAGAIRTIGAQMTIEQTTSRLGLDWQTFNIGRAASVEFRQPSANSIALNRVVGNDGSAIYGRLSANGQVFLTNPNGVLFAPGAKVDVGALVASALDLSHADFAAGRFRLSDTGTGAGVVNQGRLAAAPGGYIGLFGRQVDNEGEIAVRGGSVLLASGQAATLAISDSGLLSAVVDRGSAAGLASNRGLIDAPGSSVMMTARSAAGVATSLVNNSGIVRAASIVERNGEILLAGDDVATSGTLAADGSGPLSAGRIVVQGDMQRGLVKVDGSLSATAQQGQGGFIETSAARVSVADGARVRTLAAGGRSGLWLIDPTDYTIAPSGGDITGTALGTALSGGPVTIVSTSGSGGTAGNVNVNDAVSWSANKLTLSAQNNINVNAALIGSGAASLAFEYGQGAVAAGNTSTYSIAIPITLPAGSGKFTTKQGSNGALNSFTVVTDLTGLQAIDGNSTALAGNYALGATVDASSTGSGLGFDPIGNAASTSTSGSNSFTGIFEGLGNTINGLTVNRPSAAAVGLFASTLGATVRNLTLSGGAMTGNSYVGALAGIVGTGSVIQNVTTSTPVTSNAHAGGLAALSNGVVSNVVANGAVTGGNSADVGGLIGLAQASVSNARATGTVTSGTNGSEGGLIGRTAGSGTLTNSQATGQVIGPVNSTSVGGLVGNYTSSGAQTGNSASGNVSGGANTGGLIGHYDSTAPFTDGSYTGSSVSGGANVGGLIGYMNRGSVAPASLLTVNADVTGSGNVGGAIGRSVGSISNLRSNGDVTGTADGNVGGLIGQATGGAGVTLTGLIATGTVTNTTGNSINVGGLIGWATGTGALSSASASGNVVAKTNAGSAGGLVGAYEFSGATSVNSAAGTVTGGYNTGGLYGWYNSAAAIVDGTYSQPSITGGSFVGAIVGYMNNGSISGPSAQSPWTISTNVTGTATHTGQYPAAGGFVGRSVGSVANLKSTGSVSGMQDVGGIVGRAEGTGTLTGNMATGAISSPTLNGGVGGVVGSYSLSGAQTGNRADGNVSGGGSTGGLIGWYNSSAAITDGTYTGSSVSGGGWAGGLIGYMNQAASITGASVGSPLTVTADVTATGSAGGLVGRAYGPVSNASAGGHVSGGNGSVGGLIGQADGAGGLSHGNATGTVTGTSTSGYIGGLVGRYSNTGTLDNGTAAGNVSGGSHAGGLVGYVDPGSGSIDHSSAGGNVAVTGTSTVYAGGLVGLSYGSVSHSTASGTVSVTSNGTVYAGGLIGYIGCYYCTSSISNSSASGSVTVDATSADAGGLVGYVYAGSIDHASAIGPVSVTDSASTCLTCSSHSAGGLVGYFDYYSTPGSITNSSATGAVSGRYYTGGLVGQFNGGSITDSSASGAVSGTYYVGGLVGYGYGYGALTNVSATGNVSSILTGNYGASIGGLLGQYYLSGGALTNGFASGNVVSAVSNSSAYTGGLAGTLTFASSSATSINDSAATGSVSGGYITGGLVGYLYNYNGYGSVLNSHASGAVTGGTYTGGLIGYYYRVQAGAAADDIANSFANGNVTGNFYVGGLVGYFQGAKGIRSSYATGSVTGKGVSSTIYLGGLVGDYYATTPNSSTIAPGRIRTSYASGDVSLDSTASPSTFGNVYAGGLVGYLEGYSSPIGPAIEDAYATGRVTLDNARGRLYAGGLVGFDYYQGVTRSYASGAVSAVNGNARFNGGLVASGNSVSVTSSYWDSGGTGQSVSTGGGTALTSAQMKQSGSFAGWSIRSNGVDNGETWRSYNGYTAPLLAGFLTPATFALADTSKTYDGNTSFGDGTLAGGSITHPERVFAGIASPNVGTYTVTAGSVYSAQNGYDLSVSGSAQLTIARKTVTLDGLVADKVYDSTRTASFVGGAQPKGLVAGEDLVVDTSAASALFDTKNAGQDKTVTVSGVALADGTHGEASNYTIVGSTTTASISKAPLAVGSFTAVDRVYDGSTSVAVSVAASGSVSGKFAGDDVAVDLSGVSSGTVASKHVGTAKPVTVLGAALTGTDAGNYRIAGTEGVTVNVTPKALTVNGLVGTDRTYNRSTTVSVSTDAATLSGAVAGDVVMLSNSSVSGAFADKNVAYDGGGNVIAKAVTVSGSAFTLRGADAADYAVQNASTTAKISPYSTSVYASRTSQTDKVYDGTTVAAVNMNLSGYYSGDSIGFTNNAPAYGDKNVAYSGSTPTTKTITANGIALTGSDAANYALSNSKDGTGSYYATTYGTISPKPLTVNGVTAVNRTYDGTRNVSVNVSSATVDTSSLIGGDDVTVTLPGSGTVTGTTADKNVGTNKAVSVPGFALSGGDAGNYTLTGASSGVTVNITKKDLTASYAGIDKVYDGTPYAALHVTSADIVAGDTVRFYADVSYCSNCGFGYFATAGSTPGNYTTAKDVGSGKTVVVTSGYYYYYGTGLYGTDAGNYNLLNLTGTTSASITAKPVTLAFNGVDKVYDGTAAATVTLNKGASGIYSGDSVSVSDTAAFAAGKAVGTGKTVNVGNFVLSGTDAGNYTLSNTTATTTASITRKTVTLSGVAGVDRAYDGTTTVAVAATGALGASGFVDGDDVQVNPPSGGLSTGTVATKIIGSNKPVAVSGLSLSGGDAGNYSLDNSGVTVNITPKALTATYTGVDRVYNGGVTAQVTGASADIVGGDTVTFSQNAVFSGLDARNVGTAKPVSVTNIAIGGTDASNYALAHTAATTTASITAKPITVNYTGVNRVYSGVGDTSAQVQGGSTGIVAGDTVTFSQSAVFHSDGSAGLNKVVDVSGISLGGLQASNYSLASTTASTTATITQRPIGVSGITAANRVYDGTRVVSIDTNGATVDASAVIAGDVVSVVLPFGGITTGTIGTKDAGSNKDVAVTGLSLTGASSANYTVTGASGLHVNIAPKALTATYTVADKVYDRSALATVGWSSSDVLAGDLGGLGLTASGVFTAGKNVGTNKAVAVSGGYLTGAERNNYALQNPSASITATISPRVVTASYSGDTKVYDGTAVAAVHGSAGFLAGDQVALNETAVFTGAGAKNVGNGKPIDVSAITLSGGDAGNYALAATTASTSGNITPKSIAIQGLTGASAVNRVYDGTHTVAVNVTTSGALAPNSADIVAGDDVTINLPAGGITTGSMADKNAGSHKPVVVDGLSLTGADAGNYLIAATSGITVDIARKSLTASYTGLNKVYNGSAAATVGGSSTDILGGDTVTIGGQGVFTAGKNVGIGKAISILTAQLGGTDGGNYQLTNPTGSASADITPKSITPSYSGGTRVYDGTATAPVTSNTSGFVAGDDIALSQTAVFVNGKNVGSDKSISVSSISLTGDDRDNYALTSTGFATTGSVTPKPLRIDGLTGVTAADRVYDGTRTVVVNIQSTGTLTPNAQDLITGDVVGVTAPLNGVTTGTTANKNVGTAKPVTVAGFGLNGADAGNYVVSASSGVTVNITPKSLTATYTGVNKVYDGTPGAVVTATSSDVVAGDAVTINPTAAFDAGKAVGTAKAVTISDADLSSADAGNYLLVNPTGTTTASITPKTVSVTYTGGTKVYDRTTVAPVNANASGFIAGDDVGLSQTAVFTGVGAKNVGTNKPVQISSSALSGSDAGNYTLVPVNTTTTASITPRPVTIDGLTDVHAVDRVYNGTRSVVVDVNGVGTVAAHPGDILAGDDVTVSAPGNGQTTGTMTDKNVGSNKAVVVSGLALGGVDAGNYAIVGTQGVTVNITPRPLTATWTGANKVYDGTAATTATGASTGIIAGDQVTITASGTFDAGKNVGIGKAVTVSAGALSGTDAGNYLLSNGAGTAVADITPRNVNAAFTGGTKVYDGTTTAPVTVSASSGLIAGDDIHLDATAVFTGAGAKSVGDLKPVQVSNVTLSGADAGNYNLLNTAASTTASITPKPVTIGGLTGVTAQDRTYDGTRVVQVNVTGGSGSATTSDFITGDDVYVTGSLSGATTGLMQDKNVGSNKPVAVTGLSLGGADAGNYEVASISGVSVNITPLALQVVGLTPIGRVYDGTRAVTIDSSAATASGAISGDDVQVSAAGATGQMADKNAGVAKSVQVTGVSLSGADKDNYTFSASDLSVTITPRTLVVQASAANKVYDGTTNASATLADDRIADDQLTVSSSSTSFDNKNAGVDKTVTVSGLAVSGTDASNYTLGATSLATLATILRAPVTVVAADQAKVYGDTLTLTGAEFSASGVVAGESIQNVSLGSAGLAPTAAAGTYALSPSAASGANFDPSNYLISYADGRLSVSPRPLSVAANTVVRYEGDTRPLETGYSTNVGGLVNGDYLTGVTIPAPADFSSAIGGSVFTLIPSDARFNGSQASNYLVNYQNGLLILLPKAPTIGETGAGRSGSGDQVFVITVSAEEIRRASEALNSAATTNAQSSPAAPERREFAAAAGAGGAPPAGGGRTQISVPDLLRLPLFGLDPQMRRLIFGSE